MGRTNKTGSRAARDPPQRQQKSRAALGGGGSEGTRLDDCPDCTTEAGQGTYPIWGISFYSKWTISSQRECDLIPARRGEGGAPTTRSPIVCEGQSEGRAKKDGKERGQGHYRGRDPEGPGKVGARVRPGRRGDVPTRISNLASLPLSVVNLRCSAFKARFDAGRCVP